LPGTLSECPFMGRRKLNVSDITFTIISQI